MKRLVSIPNMTDPATIVDLAVTAETAGYDGVFLWDHVVYGDFVDFPMADPWVVLGAIAQATSTVRLGTMVTPIPRRRPWRVAQEITTLDHLSRGRAVLGVGLGWPPEEEFVRFGEASDDTIRAELLDEGLELISKLWSGEHVRHKGSHFEVDATMRPAPVQSPRPPVWVAGMWPNRAPFRRAARWDGVCPLGADTSGITLLRPEQLAECVAYIRSRRESDDPFDVIVSPHWEESPADYADAGATWLVDGSGLDPGWPDDLRARIEQGPGPL